MNNIRKCFRCGGTGKIDVSQPCNDGDGWYVDRDWDDCDECGGSGELLNPKDMRHMLYKKELKGEKCRRSSADKPLKQYIVPTEEGGDGNRLGDTDKG